MTDTFCLGQVDACDLVGAEEGAVAAVGCERPDGEAFTAKGLRDFAEPSLETDVGLGRADGAHDLVAVVFDLWKACGHGAGARPIAARRHLLVERLVRSVEVVDRTPAIESTLDLGEIAKAFQREHLRLQRAVKALVLAAALRMIGPAVQHGDAELEEPHAEPGPALPDASPQGVPLSTKKASGSP